MLKINRLTIFKEEFIGVLFSLYVKKEALNEEDVTNDALTAYIEDKAKNGGGTVRKSKFNAWLNSFKNSQGNKADYDEKLKKFFKAEVLKTIQSIKSSDRYNESDYTYILALENEQQVPLMEGTSTLKNMAKGDQLTQKERAKLVSLPGTVPAEQVTPTRPAPPPPPNQKTLAEAKVDAERKEAAPTPVTADATKGAGVDAAAASVAGPLTPGLPASAVDTPTSVAISFPFTRAGLNERLAQLEEKRDELKSIITTPFPDFGSPQRIANKKSAAGKKLNEVNDEIFKINRQLAIIASNVAESETDDEDFDEGDGEAKDEEGTSMGSGSGSGSGSTGFDDLRISAAAAAAGAPAPEPNTGTGLTGPSGPSNPTPTGPTTESTVDSGGGDGDGDGDGDPPGQDPVVGDKRPADEAMLTEQPVEKIPKVISPQLSDLISLNKFPFRIIHDAAIEKLLLTVNFNAFMKFVRDHHPDLIRTTAVLSFEKQKLLQDSRALVDYWGTKIAITKLKYDSTSSQLRDLSDEYQEILMCVMGFVLSAAVTPMMGVRGGAQSIPDIESEVDKIQNVRSNFSSTPAAASTTNSNLSGPDVDNYTYRQKRIIRL